MRDGTPSPDWLGKPAGEKSGGSMSQLIVHTQEEIAERLYCLLAFLARRSRDESVYDIRDIPSGIGSMLGLAGSQKEHEKLLVRIGTDFQRWLKDQGGRYEASWGEICLRPPFGLSLKATTFHEMLPPIEPGEYKPALTGPYS